MNERQSDAQVRLEFFDEMSRRFGDEVLSVEMVCFEAEDDVFASLQLKRVQRHTGLWGLLIVCKGSLHFYAHPTESPLLGLFRAASNRKPPAEQSFSFNMFKDWKSQKVEKRGLFGKTYEKYYLLVTAELSDGVSFVFYLRTQNRAETVFEKIAKVPKGRGKTSCENP